MAAPETITEPVRYPGPAWRRGGAKIKNMRVTQAIQFIPNTGEVSEGSLSTTSPLVSRFIHVENTPTTIDDMVRIIVTHGTGGKRAMYVTHILTATTGNNTAGRFRAESAGATKTSGETYGVHAQGIVTASKHGSTVNALYAEAIAKGTSTVITLRGAMIDCNSEATPTAITTMEGAHIRLFTDFDPSTANHVLVVDNTKKGSGVTADAMVLIKSVTWQAGNTVADAGIEFASTGKITSIIETSTPTTSVIKFSASSGVGTEAGSLKDSANADIKCDAYIKCMIDTTPEYIALYNTLN